MNRKNIVIVGGGIAGLMSAYLLSKNLNNNITIIEQENEVGGLLKKCDYGEYGVFDYGMHNILETGIPELDNLIFDLLPQKEWQILDGNKRDLVGLFINDKLQINSPYIDLRIFDKYSEYLSDFFKNQKVSELDITQYNNANEYLYTKYGKKITDDILKDIVEKFYREDIEKLDTLSTLVTPLGRVVLLDEFVMNEINKSEILRSKLAYPEQRNLDLNLSSGRKAYYPKEYGIYRVIDSLVQKLKENNVNILLNTTITSIEKVENKISTIILNNQKKLKNIDSFVWSGNPFVLSKLLDIKVGSNDYDIPAKTTVTNIIVDKKLNLDDVYYIYCYNKDMSTFRVTPYYNYCDGAKRAGGYLVSIEMLIYDNIENKDEITNQALFEITKMGLISKDSKILFSASEIIKGGFPRPTIKNIKIIDSLRDNIQKKSISNLINIGILAEKNLFFQTDVLIDLYNKMETIK